MTLRLIGNLCSVTALVFLGANFGLLKAHAASPARADADDGVQVLTRGPVHEAFAETITFNPVAGIVAPKAPPAAIEELPPDQKPAGANVAWIPGYWAWDDERSDFLWVSGTWRVVPPGRQWVPGYWGQTAQGSQWTSGYWADATATEVEYLPQPPASLEAGPNIAAPLGDQSWIPGSWAWNQTRYAWRPGYWATVQPDWTWIPAYYVWTPRGYLFVDGYWDYAVARRGVLFAPVYFSAGITTRSGFYYSPATLINPAIFANQLFLRPRDQHYYFGDYYAASYATAGFYPWFSYNSSRYGYDPIYAQQRWEHRQDRAWDRSLQADFQRRRDHEDARPPRTWAAQQALSAREANLKEKSFVVAAPLSQLARSTESPLRFQPVNQQERQRLAKDGQSIQTFRQERQKLEATAATTPGDKAAKLAAPARVKRSASPIVARSTEQLGRDQTPPKRHEVLKPKLDIEPTPKVIRAPEQPRLDRPVPPSRLDPPKSQPQPQPKVNPSPRLVPQPKVNQPAPQPMPNAATREPKPEPSQAGQKDTPKRESKDVPRGESNDKPPRESNDKPGGESKEKPKK